MNQLLPPRAASFALFALFALFASVGGGCGGGAIAKETLAIADTYANAACACKDAPCAEAAAAAYSKSMKALSAKNGGKDTGVTAEDQKKIAESTNRAVQCVGKVGGMPLAQ